MTVAVEHLIKNFGSFRALNDVSLAARPGEFLALLGPSGSGKTTLLRIMAGLEFPDTGRVTFEGADVSDRPAGARGVGFVFQHYALFKHMTVAKNVAFGLEVKRGRDRPAKEVIAARVKELLDLVQLGGMADRYPSQLSGGQRQRVALARALAPGPKLLLLDEPFGALDAKVRKELRRWLRELHEAVGLTSIFVTHDQEEALELADRVVVMDHGVIEQVGTPAEIWDQPASGFVCQFLGSQRLTAALDGDGVVLGGRRYPNAARTSGAGLATAYIRAHDWVPDDNGLPVRVKRLVRTGAATLVDGQLPDGSAVEAEIAVVPPGLLPGGTLALSPRVVRAWPAHAA